MSGVSRRLFLKQGSLAVAAAGALSAVPGLPSLLSTADSEAPAADAAAGDVSAGELTEPLVAHVRNLSTGEISLFLGDNEVTYRDPQLAARLFRAAR